MHLTAITTLDAAKQQLQIDSSITVDDDLLRFLLDAASGMIARYTGRHFVPVRATRTYDALGDHITATTLDLWADLLEASTVTNGDGAEVQVDRCILHEQNSYPRWQIELVDTRWTYSRHPQGAIAIDGIWGYHADYANAWIDTLDAVQAGGIDASATSIDVGNAGGTDARHRTRFAVGQVLRIDDEFLEVAEIDTSTDKLTVLRGVLGTTAATHDAGTQIASWAPPPEIEQVCISLVAWLYRTAEKPGERYTFLNGTSVQINDAPVHIRSTLQGYQEGWFA